MATKSCLQPLSGETSRLASANANVGARLDIRMREILECSLSLRNFGVFTFFDVRVFHPNAPSKRSRRLSSIQAKMKRECIVSEF